MPLIVLLLGPEFLRVYLVKELLSVIFQFLPEFLSLLSF
jgi:hypothetical protein